MIEIMESYKNKPEERTNETDHGDVKLIADVELNSETLHKRSSGELANFTDRRMAVMLMRVDSATAESGSDCSLADVAREKAMTVIGEVIVVEEGWNSTVVAVGPNLSQPTQPKPVEQLLVLAREVINKMAISSPSAKLLAAVHVGSLSGVAVDTSQTRQQAAFINEYQLHGPALEVCRQLMTTETAASSTTAPYTVKMTKHAVDDGGGFASSLMLVPSATSFTNDGEMVTFCVCDIGASIINNGESAEGGGTSSSQRHALTGIDR